MATPQSDGVAPSNTPATTAQVQLRDAEPSDLPLLYQYQLDPEANRMAATLPRDRETFHSHWARMLADRTIVSKVILADGLVVGSIGCFKMDGLDAVGYWIAREHWGRGIATRALSLLLEEVTIRPLHARAASTNIASIRVLQRCGFVITGYRDSPADARFLACEEAELRLS